jgi:RNA polymerase-interacting CarD/CdnL/TRCF family regulator
MKYIYLDGNIINFAELMRSLFNMVAAEERAEKEKAWLESAKDLLGRSFSIEEAAKITALELEKV